MNRLFILLLLFSQDIVAQNQSIDGFSTTSCFVLASKGSKQLWQASGFFVSVKSQKYFITNNHVVGGDFFVDQYKRNNKALPSSDTIPDSIHVRVYDSTIGSFHWINLSLIKEGKSSWIPFWENEIEKNNLLDVVAFKLSDFNITNIGICLSLQEDFDTRPTLLLVPGMELNVVGFPLDLGFNYLFPVWKKAGIANGINDFQNSFFIIDATTRQGMSGSPVFYRDNSYKTTDNRFMMGRLFTFLVGIYNSQDIDKELGGVIGITKIFKKLNSL